MVIPIEKELKEQAEKQAKKKMRSLSSYVRLLIHEDLKNTTDETNR